MSTFRACLSCLSRLFLERKHEGPLGNDRKCTVNKPCMTVQLLKFIVSIHDVSMTVRFPKLINKIQQINPYRNRTPHIKHPIPKSSLPSFLLRPSYTETSSSGRFFRHSLLGKFLSHAGLNLPCLLHVLLWHLSIINVALKALATRQGWPVGGKNAKKPRKKKGSWVGC